MMLKEGVYNLSHEDYLIPVAFVDSTNKDGYETNLIKFADDQAKTPLEFYVDESHYKLPEAVASLKNKNVKLLAPLPFVSFSSVNVGESDINSFYFSYNTSLTDKLSGISYDIEQELVCISNVVHVRVDTNAEFVCVYYGINIDQMNNFMSKVSATEDEKAKMQNVLNKYSEITHFTYSRKNGSIRLYVRGDLA